MRRNSKSTFTLDDLTLLTTFFCAWENDAHDVSRVADYLQERKAEIEITGNLMKALQLAEEDDASPLGLKPTHFLKLLFWHKANHAPTVEQASATADDRELLVKIFGCAFSDILERPDLYLWVCSVLEYLQLICFARNGDPIPTPRLLKLVSDTRSRGLQSIAEESATHSRATIKKPVRAM